MNHTNTWLLPERFTVLSDMLWSLGSSNWENVWSHTLLSIVVATLGD
jgi:hypothetical protein